MLVPITGRTTGGILRRIRSSTSASEAPLEGKTERDDWLDVLLDRWVPELELMTFIDERDGNAGISFVAKLGRLRSAASPVQMVVLFRS